MIVLDAIGAGWDRRVRLTDSADELQEYVLKSKTRVHIFVDEAGKYFEEDRSLSWIVTRGRHYGANVFLISQRAVQIPMTARDQCSRLYLFRCSAKDGKTLAEEWTDPEIESCPAYPQFVFRSVSKFGRPDFYTIDPATGIVRHGNIRNAIRSAVVRVGDDPPSLETDRHADSTRTDGPSGGNESEPESDS